MNTTTTNFKNKFQVTLLLAFSLLFFNGWAQDSATISALTFTGIKKTKASFLYRIAKVKVGQPLDSLKIETDVERIKRLDGIAHATYTVAKKADGYAVNYDLVENFSIIPGLRVGQASDDSFSFRASIFEFNGLGRNIAIGGFFQREVFNSYGIFIEHPYLISNKLGLGFNYQDLTTQQPIFFPNQEVNYTFTRRGPEFTVFYEPNFNNRLEFGTKIFKEEYQVIEGDPDNDNEIAENAPEPSANKAFFRGQHEFVDIDLEYHQVKGFRNLFEAQYFVGGNDTLATEYILTNTSQYFKRIGDKGNWASRLQLTLSNTVNDSFFVPVVIDNQINVRGGGNVIARGTASFALNTEYRHTLIEKNWFVLQSNAFVDIAGLKQPGLDFDTSLNGDNLKIYPGVGIRLIHKRIVNAVIRIDYGFKASGRGEDGGIVFGIGQYF